MILVTVTLLLLLCAVIISAAAGVAPSFVTAQQQEGEEDTSLGEEYLADGKLSDVLGWGSSDNDDNEDENDDGSGAAARDDTNTQTAVPITNQDQGAANLALNEALDLTTIPRPEPTSPTPPPPDDGGLEPECSLEITADKETYGPEDVILITITNTGDVPIEFPDSFLGLEIRNLDSEEVFPLDALPSVITFEPGASATFQFTYELLVDEIGDGLISATVPSQCDTVEEVTFTLSAPPPPPDTTVPVITVPENIVVEATSEEGAVVTYVVTAEDNVDGAATLQEDDGITVTQDDVGGDITISCEPPSGSMFPISETVVECTATDEAGNTGTGSFTVTVSPAPKENGKIAFVNYAASTGQIFVMDPDGTDRTRLATQTIFNDNNPDWSPDGTKIAFDGGEIIGRVITQHQIYVMNADGSGITRLTNNQGSDRADIDPSWSPDGTKIAFASGRDCVFGQCSNLNIYVMNADGSNPIRLTDNRGSDNADFNPSWSPDGTKIAFTRDYRNGNWDIYVMNADGSDQTRLTDNTARCPGTISCIAARDGYPSWSPDGTKIAYWSLFEAPLGGIYVMNADGSDQTKLATGQFPSWSPDGTKIAFTSYRDGNNDIYVMNADDGSDQTRLTDSPDIDAYPDWGPAADTTD